MKPKIVGLVILITVFLITIDAFAAQYNFTPRTSVRETYTDNVFLTDKNKEDDFITGVYAGGTFQALGKTSGLELISDPSYQWFANNTSEDFWRVPATLDIWSNISRTTKFEIFDRFLRDTDRVDDNPVIREEDGQIRAPGDTTDRRGREWFYTNYTTARIDHQFGSDDFVYGEFLYSLRREEDSDEGNDNDRYSPSAGMTYWFGPQWGTTIDAIYTKAKFDNSPDYDDILGTFQLMRRFSRTFQLFGRYGYANRDNDDDVPDYQVHAPSAGIIYDVAKDSRISLGGGYYYQDIDGGGNEQGPFANADVYKLWNHQRWNARLLGQAGLDRNDYGSERLGFEWFARIIANARYRFSHNFYGDVNARYRYGDFINANRQDNRYRVGAGLGWQPTQWMELTLEYFYNGLDSTADEDYQENRVWFQVKLQPDKPWRW